MHYNSLRLVNVLAGVEFRQLELIEQAVTPHGPETYQELSAFRGSGLVRPGYPSPALEADDPYAEDQFIHI